MNHELYIRYLTVNYQILDHQLTSDIPRYLLFSPMINDQLEHLTNHIHQPFKHIPFFPYSQPSMNHFEQTQTKKPCLCTTERPHLCTCASCWCQDLHMALCPRPQSPRSDPPKRRAIRFASAAMRSIKDCQGLPFG